MPRLPYLPGGGGGGGGVPGFFKMVGAFLMGVLGVGQEWVGGFEVRAKIFSLIFACVLVSR